METPTAFCAGCGHGILNRLIAEVLEEKGYEKNHIMILGVGCDCNMNFTWGGDKLQCAHGRATSAARGAKYGRPDTLIISYQGDGDAYVIGFSDTMNVAYVNTNITTFVVNNTNYAMTGGQMSWTTMPGQSTTTSVSGRDCESTGTPQAKPLMKPWKSSPRALFAWWLKTAWTGCSPTAAPQPSGARWTGRRSFAMR